ncbi:MAG: hypothetical protein O9341_10935 [Paucibacter sp.]|nr:hypothetical protein [Roseateles sp.]
MAIVNMPDDLRCGRGCKIEQVTFDMLTGSEVTGSTQSRPYGMPHWALSLVSPEAMRDSEAAKWKAMLLGLSGSVNVLAAYDPSRTEPRGSLRGAPTLAQAVAFGDTTLKLATNAAPGAATLEVGDWLQIGSGFGTSQLVLVLERAQEDGAAQMLVRFVNPARRAYAVGTPITWQRPRGYFRKPAGRIGWTPYSRSHTLAMAVDLVEAW